MNIHVHFPAIRTSHVRRLAVAIGKTVTPDTLIRIYGEVDNEMFECTKVDVPNFARIDKYTIQKTQRNTIFQWCFFVLYVILDMLY